MRNIEKVSRGFRITFVCGLRAVSAAGHDFTLLTNSSNLLSIGNDGIPSAIERLKAETKLAEKERQRLREDLARYHSARLIVEDQIKDGLRLVVRTFADRDSEYVRMLASDLAATTPHTVAIMASTADWPARLVLSKSRDLDLHCGDLLREILVAHGLRGGGSAELAQTDVPQEHFNEVLSELESAIRSRLTRPQPVRLATTPDAQGPSLPQSAQG